LADSLTAGLVQGRFLQKGRYCRFFNNGMQVPEPRERLTMLVIVGMSTDLNIFEKTIGYRVRIRLLGQSSRILSISDSDADLNVEKTAGVDGGRRCMWRHSRRNAG